MKMKLENHLGLRHLVVLMLIILLGFFSIIGIHRHFVNKSDKLDENIYNKEMEITIGRYILSHLELIENQFYKIAISKNSEYAKVIRKDMKKEIEHLKQSFETLKNGGYITHHVELNIVEKDYYEEKLYYEPTNDIVYNIESIDLIPKLDQTIINLNELILLIQLYEEAVKSNDTVKQLEFEHDFTKFMKSITPHFVRMKENASRIIYESKLQSDEYHASVLKQKEFFEKVELAISIIVIIALSAMGILVGRQVLNINMQLKKYVDVSVKANASKTFLSLI